jgi:hypothetical protein
MFTRQVHLQETGDKLILLVPGRQPGVFLFFGLVVAGLGTWVAASWAQGALGFVLLGILGSLSSLSFFLWQWQGMERIEVGAQTVSISYQLFGWQRRRDYRAEAVKRVRDEASTSTVYHGGSNPFYETNKDARYGVVAFDYEAQTVYIANFVTPHTAKRIADQVKKHLKAHTSDFFAVSIQP